MLRAITRGFKLDKTSPQTTKRSLFSATMDIPRDVRDFIEGYPNLKGEPGHSENLAFYSNAQPCRPDNQLIDEIHEQYVFLLCILFH